MFIVAISLCKCLFEDGHPEKIFIADSCKDSLCLSVFLCPHGQVFIHCDSHGKAKHVQIDTVDATQTLLVRCVEEKVLDAAGYSASAPRAARIQQLPIEP